jgi:hypothetical protein
MVEVMRLSAATAQRMDAQVRAAKAAVLKRTSAEKAKAWAGLCGRKKRISVRAEAELAGERNVGQGAIFAPLSPEAEEALRSSFIKDLTASRIDVINLEALAERMAEIIKDFPDARVDIRNDSVIGVGVFLRGIPTEELHVTFGKVYDAVQGNTGPVHVAFTEQNSTLVLIPGGIHRGK